jgi:hypothetical protein
MLYKNAIPNILPIQYSTGQVRWLEPDKTSQEIDLMPPNKFKSSKESVICKMDATGTS